MTLAVSEVSNLGNLACLQVADQPLDATIHAFFVRKVAKTHGAQQKIDGHLRNETEILVVDDVATTGDSIMDAVSGMDGYGPYVRSALVVIDREDGAVDNLAAHGIQLSAIFKTSDFQA